MNKESVQKIVDEVDKIWERAFEHCNDEDVKRRMLHCASNNPKRKAILEIYGGTN